MSIGVFSFLASQNVYLGLVINIVVIFFIAYAFFYDLKTSVWSSLILTYLILLVNPLKIPIDFSKRLIALEKNSVLNFKTTLKKESLNEYTKE